MTELHLIRAEIINYGYDGVPEFQIEYRYYEVLRETKLSYIIKYDKKEKRVPKQGKRVFARLTTDEALNDLIHRNSFYIDVLKWRLDYSKKMKKFLLNHKS